MSQPCRPLDQHDSIVVDVVIAAVVVVFVDVVAVFVDAVVVVIVDVIVVVVVVDVDVSRKTRRDKKWFPSNFRASVICLVL